MASTVVASRQLNSIVPIEFGRTAKPLTLVGVAQTLVLNLNAAIVTGSSIKVVVEFLEY